MYFVMVKVSCSLYRCTGYFVSKVTKCFIDTLFKGIPSKKLFLYFEGAKAYYHI